MPFSFLALYLAAAKADHLPKYKAVFDADFPGLTGGSLSIEGANVTISLAGLTDLMAGDELTYHIHEKWNQTGVTAAYPSCGAAFTSGHYDPTLACGSASGNPRCVDTACWNSTLNPYDCTPTTYAADPFACEVGDLSGKLGKLVVTADKTAYSKNLDPYLPPDLSGLSVVVHKGTTRLFCAELVEDNALSEQHPERDPWTLVAGTDFAKVWLNTTHIWFLVDYTKLPSGAIVPDACKLAGANIMYHVHSKWTHTDKTVAYGSDCNLTYTGNHVDQGYACGPNSDQALCAVTACDLPDPNPYACSPSTYAQNPYNCETGDLSGKVGAIEVGTGGITPKTFKSDYYAFPFEAGQSIVWHCGGVRAYCAKLMTPPQQPSSGVRAWASPLPVALFSLVLSLFITTA
eukprot:g58030.t1